MNIASLCIIIMLHQIELQHNYTSSVKISSFSDKNEDFIESWLPLISNNVLDATFCKLQRIYSPLITSFSDHFFKNQILQKSQRCPF